jgi:hypothetical protein
MLPTLNQPSPWVLSPADELTLTFTAISRDGQAIDAGTYRAEASTYTPLDSESTFIPTRSSSASLFTETRENQKLVVVAPFIRTPRKAHCDQRHPLERTSSVIARRARCGRRRWASMASLRRGCAARRPTARRFLERSPGGTLISDGQLIRWYSQENHQEFDVCADDHCQRYQGLTKAVGENVAEAIRSTSGKALTFGDRLCEQDILKRVAG